MPDPEQKNNKETSPGSSDIGPGDASLPYRTYLPVIQSQRGSTPLPTPTQSSSPPQKTATPTPNQATRTPTPRQATRTPQPSATPTPRQPTSTPTPGQGQPTRTLTPTRTSTPGTGPQWSIYIDLKRCIGCNACSLACKQQFNVAIGERWNQVYGAETGTYPAPSVRVLPMLCHHCGNAPCKAKCDSLGHNAIVQRSDGIVYVDAARCVGCQSCLPVCPYKAMWFNSQTRKAEKCDLCRERIDAGLLPACVITCLAITREFGDYQALKTRHPNAKTMGGRVKVLYDNLGSEPEHDGATGGYPSPVECHH